MERKSFWDYNVQELYAAEKNLERFVFVRLKNRIHTNPENSIQQAANNCNLFVGLQRLAQHVFTFEDAQNCLDCLRSLKKSKVILIISRDEPSDDEMISIFVSFRHVVCVYDYRYDQCWRKNWTKIDPVVDPETPLRMLPFSTLAKSINEFDELSQIFIINQLLIKLLLDIPGTCQGKEAFVSYCLEKYAGNKSYIEDIRKFEATYTPDQAIYWYTKPTFVFKTVRQVCASNDLKLIFKIRFFLADLQLQLKKLYEEQEETLLAKKVVYTWRGKPTTKTEIDHLKKNTNNVLITNSFMSTTTDKNVADMFAGDESVAAQDKLSVIFSIKIDTKRKISSPLAFIGQQSFSSDEAEILLTIGFFFRMNSIEKIKVTGKTYNSFSMIFYLG